jgi:signal transduction histidine kinase
VRVRLLLGFVLFAVLATALLVVPIGLILQSRATSGALNTLRRDERGLEVLITDALNHGDLHRVLALTDSYEDSTGRQVLVLDSKSVLVTSQPRLARDTKLLAIAESAPRNGGPGISGISPNTSTNEAQYYVAVRLVHVHAYLGSVVLVVAAPVRDVNSRIKNNWQDLALYGVLMLVLAALFGFIISGSLVRPLRKISRAVEAVGSGALDVRAPESMGPRELRVLAQVINATSARLITLLEAQRAFVEDASHQLRTPLTSLQLHLENLQRGNSATSEVDLSNVLSEMERLSRLVDSLLALARNESRTPILVEVDLHDLLLERADVWGPLASELGLTLQVGGEPSLVVLAVEDALEQILDNLLANAFDATPEGGHIRIEAFRVEEHIELHVIDNGPGMSAADRANALRRFWRGRENSSEGTGLGLAIVDQLVQLSGGSIELREAVGGGLDATITFRRVE